MGGDGDDKNKVKESESKRNVGKNLECYENKHTQSRNYMEYWQETGVGKAYNKARGRLDGPTDAIPTYGHAESTHLPETIVTRLILLSLLGRTPPRSPLRVGVSGPNSEFIY